MRGEPPLAGGGTVRTETPFHFSEAKVAWITFKESVMILSRSRQKRANKDGAASIRPGAGRSPEFGAHADTAIRDTLPGRSEKGTDVNSNFHPLAPVAQRIELRIPNPGVACSSHAGGTNKINSLLK